MLGGGFDTHAGPCFEHSIFLKVNAFGPRARHSAKSIEGAPRGNGGLARPDDGPAPRRDPAGPLPQESNYELFNRSNFKIRYWSWNYRGCWHQTCPPMGPR